MTYIAPRSLGIALILGAITAFTTSMSAILDAAPIANGHAVTVSSGVLRISKSMPGSIVVSNSSPSVAGTLSGIGTISGDVEARSTSASAPAQVYPDGTGERNSSAVMEIHGNLTFGPNARPVFKLSFDHQACDMIKLTGDSSILTCGGAQVALAMNGEQLSAEFPLITLTGHAAKISGTFNPKPLWLGKAPVNAANYSIAIQKNDVILRYNLPHVTLYPKVASEWPRFYCGPDDKAQIRKQIEAVQATMKVSGSLVDWAFDKTENWDTNTKGFWESIHKQYDDKEFNSGRRLAEQLQSFNIVMAYGKTSPADYQWMEKRVATYINHQLQVSRYSDTLSRKSGMGNGDIEQFYPMLQAAILFPKHPDAQLWLDRSVDWISQCVQGCWIDGVGLESSRYYGTVLSELSNCLPMIEHGTGINLYHSPALRAGLEWWIRYISPPVVPHGFPYTLPAWGDADVAADFGNHVPYIKAYSKFDPDFSRRLAGWWRKSGGKVPGGWMNPLIAPQVVDVTLPGSPENSSAPATSTYSPTFGQMTMRSESSDANEIFLTMKCGKGPNGHCHGDQGGIELYALGRMLLTESYCGPYGFGMDWARASRAHNTVVYNNRNTDGTTSGQFQAYGASTVADYSTVSWGGEGTARHVVMVKPDYVVIWDQAAAGSFSDYWMHSDATKLDWQPHKVGVQVKPGDVSVDVHFLLPSYALPVPDVKGEPLSKNETTVNWMASQTTDPNTAGPYTREGLGLQAWGMPPNPPPGDTKSKYIKYFSVRSATAGGHFLTVLHPRKVGVTPELRPALVSSSATSVTLKVSINGRVDMIKIDNNGATIAKGGQPPVQFARTYPWSGVSGPARFILCQDNAVETLNKPLPTTGAVELIIGKLALGADNVLPSSAPVIVRPSGVLDLGMHNATVGTLTVDCGTIIGSGTLTCHSLEWYGGSVAPTVKIVCKGKIVKHAGTSDVPISNE